MDVVFVREYERERFGRRERVATHTRRWPKPRQLTLPFC